jgi:PAS domain S-box-containing protein
LTKRSKRRPAAGLSDNLANGGSRSDAIERLFTLSPAMLCIAGTDAYFKRVNPAFQDKLGYTEAELLSRPFIDFVHPDDRESTLAEVSKLSIGTPTVHFENRYRHANGSYRWLLWNTVPVANEGLLYATAIDITDRKRAEDRYRELERESAQEFAENERKLQAMANRLVLAEENERRRIARGLHDDVGQTLLTAKMAVEELQGAATRETQTLAQEVQKLLEYAIQSTRSLSFDLASEVLYDVGLGAAMQSLCKRAEKKSGIEFQPPAILRGNPIPESERVILYRVGRELIQNIVKHSRARRAKLSLTLEAGIVRLTVEDDGCGFEVEKQRESQEESRGFGLFSIEQQLHQIGGELEIVSAPDNGTRATVTFPLPMNGAGL